VWLFPPDHSEPFGEGGTNQKSEEVESLNISGRLEPIQFTVTKEGDRQVVSLYAMKSGHTYRREFDETLSIQDMLAKVKLDLFSV